MSDNRRPANAFSEDYLTHLRDRDEPEGPWGSEGLEPLVIYEHRGGFGLFKPWHRPDLGDEPEVSCKTLEDARTLQAARLAARRNRYYELEPALEPRQPEGFPVKRDGKVVAHLRSYDPDWVYACHVLTCATQSSEHLVTLLDLAGPTVQEQVGEILGRRATVPASGEGEEDDTQEESPGGAGGQPPGGDDPS